MWREAERPYKRVIREIWPLKSRGAPREVFVVRESAVGKRGRRRRRSHESGEEEMKPS